MKLKRVRILGAESCGKTTLARDLARRFGTVWVPEYGRDYTEQRKGGFSEGQWTSEEFLHIAQAQVAAEDRLALEADGVLFCDTDALATALWHERYLGTLPPEVLDLARHRSYDLTFLALDDVPFEADAIRDGEHLRGWMTGRFREVLAAEGAMWTELSGGREARLAAAAARVEALLR